MTFKSRRMVFSVELEYLFAIIGMGLILVSCTLLIMSFTDSMPVMTYVYTNKETSNILKISDNRFKCDNFKMNEFCNDDEICAYSMSGDFHMNESSDPINLNFFSTSHNLIHHYKFKELKPSNLSYYNYTGINIGSRFLHKVTRKIHQLTAHKSKIHCSQYFNDDGDNVYAIFAVDDCSINGDYVCSTDVIFSTIMIVRIDYFMTIIICGVFPIAIGITFVIVTYSNYNGRVELKRCESMFNNIHNVDGEYNGRYDQEYVIDLDGAHRVYYQYYHDGNQENTNENMNNEELSTDEISTDELTNEISDSYNSLNNIISRTNSLCS